MDAKEIIDAYREKRISDGAVADYAQAMAMSADCPSDVHYKQLIRILAESVIHEKKARADENAEIRKLVAEHDKRQGISYCRSLPEAVRGTYDELHNTALNALASQRQFRDDLLTEFRAMAIVVESAASASTHGEKNARLRGIGTVIDSAVKKLRSCQFPLSGYRGGFDFDGESIWRSDYPYAYFRSRIRDLETELANAKGGTKATDPEAEDELPRMPF